MQRPEAAPETRSPFSFKRFGCRVLGVGRRREEGSQLRLGILTAKGF